MSINLFIEETDFLTKGAYFFDPQHCFSSLETGSEIDVVYFPYMINGGFLTPQMQDILIPRMPQEFLGTPLEYEYMNGQVPKYLCNLYRKRLKKKHPVLSKKTMVFLHIADFAFPYETDGNTIIVRCSVNRTTMQKTDIVMPAKIPYEEWKGPQRDIKPSIGFCGCPYTHKDRQAVLRDLEQLKLIHLDTNFTQYFYNHIDKHFKHNYKHIPEEMIDSKVKNIKSDLKQKFIKILDENIFSLCPRGRGNYSVRFYETLRAGRIPVMVDSDQVFPCEDIIDWDDIVICAKNTEEMVQKMYDWLEHRDIIEVQKRCREVWETHLYFPKFVEYLPQFIEKSLS